MDYEQGSQEWLQWRRGRIGGSDAPVIMGVSPYKTRRELWLEKTGKVEEELINEYISNKGHSIEEKARDILMVKTGTPWLPRLFEFSSNERFAASLDGWNDDLQAVWECKLLGKEYYSNLTDVLLPIRKRIPEHYWPQLMHQAMVTGAKEIWFTGMYIDKEERDFIETISFEVGEECIQYIRKELHPQLLKFINMIDNDEEPELTARDTVETDNNQLKELLSDYKMIQEHKKDVDAKEKALKKAIFEISSKVHNRVVCNGVKITESKTEDKIVPDYEAYCEGKDLTGFTKIQKGRVTQRITFPKEE